MTSAIRPGQPYDEAATARIVEQFYTDGYVHLGPVLQDDEVAALRGALERKASDPRILADEAGDHVRGISYMRMFEYDNVFRDLIVREPFASLAEAVLGADCHVMSQNALIYPPGMGGGWHVDDLLHYPLPEGIERHDARVRLPCLIMQVFTPLSDVDTVECGCTEVVPGSHLAGRKPDSDDNPTFEGQGPVPLLARAGEAYLMHNQIWHRGATNRSANPRILGGVTYSRRFVAQKFYPFIDYRMPAHVWDGADERLQRFLGRHSKGAYG